MMPRTETFVGECGQEIDVHRYRIKDFCNKCGKVHLFKIKEDRGFFKIDIAENSFPDKEYQKNNEGKE